MAPVQVAKRYNYNVLQFPLPTDHKSPQRRTIVYKQLCFKDQRATHKGFGTDLLNTI